MASLSSPPLHFNQGLRYKMLLFRAFQLWNLKHPHALSQILLHKNKKTKKPTTKKVKKKKKTTTKNKMPKSTQRKEVFSLSLFFYYS